MISNFDRPLLAKKFSIVVFVVAVFFVIYHLIVWFNWTSKIFDASPYYIGDLSRIAYQPYSIHPRLSENDLKVLHFDQDNWDGKPIDILTIGDSFLNGGGKVKTLFFKIT